MLINVYLDINPITNKPFYVGVGLPKRCSYKRRENKYHRELVKTFPDKKFERKILYENVEPEKAYRIEKQIIKRCGRLCNGSGCLANVHKGGKLEFFGNGDYIRGFKMKDIYGDAYKHHQEGKPYLYMHDEATRKEIIKESRRKMLETKKERIAKIGRSELEINSGKNKIKRIKEKGFTEKELKGYKTTAEKNRGRTMQEATGNPDWVCWRKGKSHKELFGENYVSPRTKNIDYNPDFVYPHVKPFKLIVNNSEIIFCLNEEEFEQKTKLHNRVLQKLKKNGKYKVLRRQHNTIHKYSAGDEFTYHSIDIEEYKLHCDPKEYYLNR